MKNSFKTLIYSFFGLLFLSACAKNTPPESTDLSAKITSINSQIQQEQNRKQFDQAVQTMNLTLCSSITDAELKYTCEQNVIIKKAEESGDPTICNQLATAELQEECQTTVAN